MSLPFSSCSFHPRLPPSHPGCFFHPGSRTLFLQLRILPVGEVSPGHSPLSSPSVLVSDLRGSLPVPCLFAHLDLDPDLLDLDRLNLFSPKLKDSGNLLLPLGAGFGLLLRQDRPGFELMVTQKRIFLAQISQTPGLFIHLILNKETCLHVSKGTSFFLAVSHGMWVLSSPTRDQTHAPCIGSTLEVWSLNH